MSEEEARTLSILYKRRGYFDNQREELLKSFQGTPKHEQLLKSVQEIVTTIVNENPDLLLRNKGQLSALVEGVISRSNIFDLIDEEVKQSTIGSEQLRADIRKILTSIKEGN